MSAPVIAATAATTVPAAPSRSSQIYTCLRCGPVTPRSTLRWKVLYVLTWPAALVGPLLFFGPLALVAVVVLPFGVLMMGGPLAAMHERAFPPPCCPTCQRLVLRADEVSPP